MEKMEKFEIFSEKLGYAIAFYLQPHLQTHLPGWVFAKPVVCDGRFFASSAEEAHTKARALVLKQEGLIKDLTFVDEGGDHRFDGRFFTALYGEHRFFFIAQLWDDEGRLVGTHPEAGVMHYGLKAEEDPALFFCDSPAWDAFEAATGITQKELEEIFFDFIEEQESEED